MNKEEIGRVKKIIEDIEECGLSDCSSNKKLDCNLLRKVLSELEKQDKIINLMAERLTTPIHSKEWIIDYYKREIEK